MKLHQNLDSRIAYVKTSTQLIFILNGLHAEDLVKLAHHITTADDPDRCSSVWLTPKGWNKVAELERAPIASKPNQAFVAMWFNSLMNSPYESGIKRGIELAGYDAQLFNPSKTIGKIDDGIIAEIRMSKFVVADFSGQRQNVYYEAGFARGMGIPVVSTCNKKDIEAKEVHFDTSHYSHIPWEENKLDEFAQALANTIIANLGRGTNPIIN